MTFIAEVEGDELHGRGLDEVESIAVGEEDELVSGFEVRDKELASIPSQSKSGKDEDVMIRRSRNTDR